MTTGDRLYEVFSTPLLARGLRVLRQDVEGGISLLVVAVEPSPVGIALFRAIEPEYVGLVLKNGLEYWENEWDQNSMLEYAADMSTIVLHHLDAQDPSQVIQNSGLKRARVGRANLVKLLDVDRFE